MASAVQTSAIRVLVTLNFLPFSILMRSTLGCRAPLGKVPTPARSGRRLAEPEPGDAAEDGDAQSLFGDDVAAKPGCLGNSIGAPQLRTDAEAVQGGQRQHGCKQAELDQQQTAIVACEKAPDAADQHQRV